MERQYSKRLDFKYIYIRVTKYGTLISELAEKYDMDEKSFRTRMKMGLNSKLYVNALKADARNRKNRQSVANKQHYVKKRTSEKTIKQKFHEQQSARESKTTGSTNIISEVTLEVLKTRKMTISSRISEIETNLATAKNSLAVCENIVLEMQKVFEEAKIALDKAVTNRNCSKKSVDKYNDELNNLKNQLADTEQQIRELKDNSLYLVSPGYSGDIPEFGKFISNTQIAGFNDLQIIESTYDIEPQLKDMLVAGYDSYNEYMESLRFVMLCAEYTCLGKEYSVLVSDDRIQKLISSHIGAISK